MGQLKALGNEKMRQVYAKKGAGENHFGVKLGDLRALAKKLGVNPALARALWQTGNVDAMLLSILVMNPREIAADELESMVAATDYTHLADWLSSYAVRLHPQKEELRQKWMKSKQTMLCRAGWNLTAERVMKNPDGLDLGGLLDRIEKEMGAAPEALQWTMNNCLAAIGIQFPEHRERAIAIGEKLGVFRDYPTSKGCTSPFAPIWIAEMVKREQRQS